jgi:hypothetical protein
VRGGWSLTGSNRSGARLRSRPLFGSRLNKRHLDRTSIVTSRDRNGPGATRSFHRNHPSLSPVGPFQDDTVMHPNLNRPLSRQQIDTNTLVTPPNLVDPRIYRAVANCDLATSRKDLPDVVPFSRRERCKRRQVGRYHSCRWHIGCRRRRNQRDRRQFSGGNGRCWGVCLIPGHLGWRLSQLPGNRGVGRLRGYLFRLNHGRGGIQNLGRFYGLRLRSVFDFLSRVEPHSGKTEHRNQSQRHTERQQPHENLVDHGVHLSAPQGMRS